MLSNDNLFDRVFNYILQAATLITLMVLTLGPKRIEHFAKRIANTQFSLWTLIGEFASLLLMSDYATCLIDKGVVAYCLWTKDLCIRKGAMVEKNRNDLRKQIRSTIKRIRKFEKKYGA